MFSKRLKELRKSTGMTQADIANLVGLSHQAVGKWERGEATPDFDALCKLAARFSCSIDYLIKGGKEPIRTEPPTEQAFTDDEKELIRLYRFTDEWGREQIMSIAESNARRYAGLTGKKVKVAM